MKKQTSGKNVGDRVEMTMKKMWFKWTNENHTFENVSLSKYDVEAFSGAVKEYIDHDRDEMGKPLENGRNWLPSLKYTFAAVPKPNEKSKPLTNDQKQQNLVFSRECKKLWKEASSELRERVIEGVQKLERKKGDSSGGKDSGSSGSGGGNMESNRKESESESESKSKSAGETDAKIKDSDKFTSNKNKNDKISSSIDSKSVDLGKTSGSGNTSKYELSVLNELSLKRLRDWVEEDEDKLLEREKEKLQEKNEEAKKMHQQFVRKKDGLRIRLPDPSEIPKPAIPRMDYANKADIPVNFIPVFFIYFYLFTFEFICSLNYFIMIHHAVIFFNAFSGLFRVLF